MAAPSSLLTRLRRLDDRLAGRRWLHRTVITFVTVLSLVIGGVDLFFVTQGGEGTAVAVDDVLAEFRAADPVAAPQPAASPVVAEDTDLPRDEQPAEAPETATTGAEQAPATEPQATPTTTEATSEPAPQPEPAPSSPSAAPAPAPEPSPKQAPPAPAPAPTFALPTQGVYTYATTGGEEINTPGGKRSYPEETFGVLRLEGGCAWSIEFRVLEEHREAFTLCTEGPVITETESRSDIVFYGAENRETYTCDLVHGDLGAAPGSTTTGRCTGDQGTNTEKTTEVIGREVLVVGGVQVETIHTRSETVISGASQGFAVTNQWITVDTGLIVRVERVADSSRGAIDYHEEVTFMLQSLTPRS